MKTFEKRFEMTGPIILGDYEFSRLGNFIMSQYGIKMPPYKKLFLQSRLQKRLRELGISDFKTYTDYLFTPKGKKEEIPMMIDVVSTNKTDFFREPIHFEFLLSKGLSSHSANTRKKNLSVWSAGCSSGEEPYTIAMILEKYAQTIPDFDYYILATDISNRVLQHAKAGIYNLDNLDNIPADFQNKFLQKGKGVYENKFRIASDIRNKVIFERFNLLENTFNKVGKFDIIFCRNVLIYFERDIQYKILVNLCRQLNVGGYLFLGHSESVHGLDLPLKHIRPTIFTKYDVNI